MKRKILKPVHDFKLRLALYAKLATKGIRLNYRPSTEELIRLAR